jgi:hypothetical protein
MAQCYLCNAGIPRGGGNRRWVPTSRGTWISQGRSGARVGYGASQGVRTVCDGCADQLQVGAAAAAKFLWISAVVVVVVLALLFVIGSMHGR